MFSFLRAASPPRTNNASNNPIHYENGLSSVTFHPPNSPYCMTHVLPPGLSIITPPFHYHIHQDEFFRVHSGLATFHQLGTSTTIAAGATTAIKAGRYHRFENASATDPLVVDIQLAPEAYESEQRFFRNFFGYLDDCKTAGAAPSFFQLMVFLESADTPLAVPVPWEALGRALSRVLLAVAAGWGRWGLGYRETYREYYEDGKSK